MNLPTLAPNPPVPAAPKKERRFSKANGHIMDIKMVEEALRCIDPTEYLTWIIIGMALKWAWPDEQGFELWCHWSASYPNFSREECERKWATFNNNPESAPVTLGTLIAYAKKGGWSGGGGAALPSYVFQNGNLFLNQPGRNGGMIYLANFNAQIRCDITYDDGASQNRQYEITATLYDGAELPVATVPAEEFINVNKWVSTNWGARAVIGVGRTAMEHLARAIQGMSADCMTEETRYLHTGWRNINGIPHFLHSGGAISPGGFMDHVKTEPRGKLADYMLNEPDDIPSAVKSSLALLNVGPDSIMVPLLGAAYRAPLGHFNPNTFSVFCVGCSGTFKSTVSGLIMSHFGPKWSGSNLTDNWSSTANEIEYKAFLVKDCLTVIDDYVPTGEHYEIRALRQKAERVFRGQGNQSGRGRLNANCELRPEYSPRGIVISSGEDMPVGPSLRARIVFVPFQRGDINLEVLTVAQAQAKAGVFSQAMFAYIHFLALNAMSLPAWIEAWHLEYRSKAESFHARIPENTASVMVGWKCFLTFAKKCGTITSEETEALENRAWEAMAKLTDEQSEATGEEDPASRFLGYIRQALGARRAHLSSAFDNKEPEIPQIAGWKARTIVIEGCPDDVWDPQGDMIGWWQGSNVWLLPDVAYAVAERIAREHNKPLAFQMKAITIRLKEGGLLLSADKGRNTLSKTFVAARHRVLHLDAAKVLGYHPGGQKMLKEDD